MWGYYKSCLFVRNPEQLSFNRDHDLCDVTRLSVVRIVSIVTNPYDANKNSNI